MNEHMSEKVSPYSDEKLFHSVIEASPAGMLIVDQDGKIVLANRAAGEQFGYSPRELVEQSIDILVPEASRGGHAALRARYMSQPAPRAMGAERHLLARRSDGSEFPVDVSLHPIEVQQRHMVLAYVLDATDRRRAERDREQQQAMERLALMGQLAGGVAHEIRTPLCVIRNDAYFLKMMADRLGEEGMECVEEINQAVLKAERIVSELLDFTRDWRGEAQVANIGELVEAAIRAVTIPSTIELVQKLGDEEIWVRVDPEQIERILINLIRNAAQALGDKGKIEIVAATRGAQLVLQVNDNGSGIPSHNLERVFEPLFTTKPQGIGLGLAVSRQYATRNGGTLVVRNLDGAGACFELTLPLAGHAP